MVDLERPIRITKQLQAIGVSRKGILQLLALYPYEQIEDQLKYLPYRKAKRKEALIVEAIRHNYSPPNEYFYAAYKATRNQSKKELDPDPELSIRQALAEPQRHGTESGSRPPAPDDWLE